MKSVTIPVFLPFLIRSRKFSHSSFLSWSKRTSRKMLVSTRYMVEHFFSPDPWDFMLKSY